MSLVDEFNKKLQTYCDDSSVPFHTVHRKCKVTCIMGTAMHKLGVVVVLSDKRLVLTPQVTVSLLSMSNTESMLNCGPKSTHAK